MTLKTPIKKETLQKTVFNALRDAILIRELEPGEYISLQEIAQQLNVSTMPVREALRQLETLGLIRFDTKKRIQVTKLSVEDLEEFYWIRIPLETRAFKRNYDTLQERDLNLLTSLHRKMCKNNIAANEWTMLNRQFHMILYGADKSPVLKGALDWLWHNVTPYLNLFAQSPSLQIANDAHANIIEKINEDKLDEVVALLKEHLRSGLVVVGQLLRK